MRCAVLRPATRRRNSRSIAAASTALSIRRRARIGQSRIRTGHRLGAYSQDEGGVTAYFFDRNGHRATARGDVLIGCGDIHSRVREMLFPDEGPARWNGIMLWRGAVDWPAFLTGRSMIVAGGLAAKFVVYPIGEGSRADRKLTNWAVTAKIGDSTTPQEGGLVQPRPDAGPDASPAALPHARHRRRGPNRGDRRVLGISDVRPRSVSAVVSRLGDTAEFVLGRMDVRRDKGARWKGCCQQNDCSHTCLGT